MEKNGYFDYIFIGAGASSTLLLRSLESRGLLANKKIAVIDSDSKSTNDKTYCFWTSLDDDIAQDCNALISENWSKVSVNQQNPESLENARYVHISSIALYEDCRRIVNDYRISRIYSSVSNLNKLEEGVEIQTKDGVLQGKIVFDSRPPVFAEPKKNEVILWQTFIGHIISIEKSYEKRDCVDLMDFDVPQDGFTQFMYVLPLKNNQILVELTRFGSEPITQSLAEPILAAYIEKRFGSYQLIDTEQGKIPMSTAKIERELMEGVVPIGGRSGAIKPSTGYAFKNMFQAAEHIAGLVENKKEITPMKIGPKRFDFYDRLLLLILFYQPMLGKPIFSALFKKNRVVSVFQFLEGRTNIAQDIRILLTLPIRPFLRVLGIELQVMCKGLIFPLLTFCLALFLLAIQVFATSYSVSVQVIVFSIGFLAVGLPHGAVDFLLENGMHGKGVTFSFVMRYISLSLAFLGIWALSSNLALLLFIAYSIWHFGQCDFRVWNADRSNAFKNILWGFLLFGILLIGHQSETNVVLSSLHAFQFPFSVEHSSYLVVAFLSFAFAWSIYERKAPFFITVSMLSIGLFLPLLTAFSLYFIGQHSINGWRHLKTGLQTNNRELYVKSLPFNTGAIGLLVIFCWLTEKYFPFQGNLNAVSIFFVFLSCISFPHIIWIHKFYIKK